MEGSCSLGHRDAAPPAMDGQTSIPKRQPTFSTVSSLRPDTAGWNLVVKVVDVKVVLTRQARPNTQPARIAECLVGDQTGCIIFTARNEQVDLLEKGRYLILRNAKIDMYKGSMRIAVNNWGKVEVTEPEQQFEPKEGHNLSLVEYELVCIDPAEAAVAEGEVAAAAAPAAVAAAPAAS